MDPYFSDKTPGPGTYNVEPASRAISRRPPSYTMAGKLDSPANYGAPGPGSYSPRLEPYGPVFTIQGRNDRKGEEAGPGPGQYDSDISSSTRRPPGYSMKGKYRGPKGAEIPGPGTYNLRSRSDAPSFTMQGKFRGAAEERNPGPGAYNASSSSDKPRITIGERRPDPSPRGTPGPGAYSAKCPSNAPKYSFGQRHRHRDLR